jgi:hypothetical protein
VALCQATLSIGLYLLLEGTFRQADPTASGSAGKPLTRSDSDEYRCEANHDDSVLATAFQWVQASRDNGGGDVPRHVTAYRESRDQDGGQRVASLMCMWTDPGKAYGPHDARIAVDGRL